MAHKSPPMTLEDTGLSEQQVMSVRDRSLEESYEDHDIGMAHLRPQLEVHGFDVEDHGDDARHADAVLYGDGPDLRLVKDGETVAYIEVKVKTSQEWFGRCNRRHFDEYVNFSRETDVPVFIWFALVDTESDQLQRSAFFEVEDTDQIDGDVLDVSDQTVVCRKADLTPVAGGTDDEQFVAVDADDILGVDPRDEIADSIPEVHGNEVVCLNENELRSMPHFLHVVSP